MKSMENLYDRCQKDNRMFYDDLFEAYVNRNPLEQKDIANLAIQKNVEFSQRFIRIKPNYRLGTRFLKLIISIEALERSFSRTDASDLDSMIKPEVRIVLDKGNKKFMEKCLNLQRRKLWKLIKEEGATAFRTVGPHHDALRAICKYYLVFRAIREHLSSYQAKERNKQIKEKVKILKRSIDYTNLAIAVDDGKIESYLVKGMLHKEFSFFDKDDRSSMQLWQAFLTQIYAYTQIDRSVTNIYESAAARFLNQDGLCFKYAQYKMRIANDVGRICETLSTHENPVNIGIARTSTKLGLRHFVGWEKLAAPDNLSIFDKNVWHLFEKAAKQFEHTNAKKMLGIAIDIFKVLEMYEKVNLLSLFGEATQKLIDEKSICLSASRQNKNAHAHVHLHNLGRCLMRNGDSSAALRYYKEALRVDPDYTAARESLALLLLAKGDSPSADRNLRIARRLYREKNNPRIGTLKPNLADVILGERDQRTLLKKYLVQKRTLNQQKGFQLAILRRWNSYTPSVPTKPKSLGGGYFLTIGKHGIVIDPGFDFLHNFSKAGYSLQDITHILISHLHADHINDLEQMLFLFREQRKRTGKPPQDIYICGTGEVIKGIANRLGAFQYKKDKDKPTALFNDLNFILLPAPMKAGTVKTGVLRRGNIRTARTGKGLENTKWPDDFQIKAVPTYHLMSRGRKDTKSCGFRITIPKMKGRAPIEIGFTSDTAWNPDLAMQFDGCNLLIAHVGELYEDDINETGGINKKPKGTKRNHLGLHGIFNLILKMPDKERTPEITIVSEFGEELGIYRDQIAKCLNDALFYEKIPTFCLTGDLGLHIRFAKDTKRFEVRCRACGVHRYRPIGEMSEIVHSHDDDSEIVYFCHRHDESVVRERLKATSPST